MYAAALAEQLDSEAERHAATTRMLDHYLHTAHAADQLLDRVARPLELPQHSEGVSPEPLADREHAMGWFIRERPVLLAAIDESRQVGFDVHTWQLALVVDTFLSWQGHWYDQVAVWRTAIEAAERMNDKAAEALAHRLLSGAYWSLHKLSDADSHLRHALALYDELDDLIGQARAHIGLARLRDREASHTEALEHGERALELYQAAGHQTGQAHAFNTIGWCQVQLGHHDLAVANCQQALALHRKLVDRDGESTTLDSLGYAHHHLGNFDAAIACYEDALKVNREIGNRYNEAETLTHLAETQSAAGNPDAARTTWRQTLAILEDLDHPDAVTVRAKLEGGDPR